MILQDLAQDLKVFLVKIIETPCEECIKYLLKSFQYLVGIIHVLSNILIC